MRYVADFAGEVSPSDPCTECGRPIFDGDKVWLKLAGPVCGPCMQWGFTLAMRALFVHHAAWLYQCGGSPFWSEPLP